MPIEVRLVFETGGFCKVSFLASRDGSLPDQLLLSNSGNKIELLALQEDWYQDLLLPNTATLLRSGMNLEASLSDRSIRWTLSGREVYVLARHDYLSGFLSTGRLLLGEQHVVLTAAERASEVLEAIQRTDSPEPEIIDSDRGAPSGWLAFRGVTPMKAVMPGNDGDIMDVLCPLPLVQIVLKGGIRVGRSTWLSECPPLIRLRGNEGAIELVIDGHKATLDESGAYVAPGWDLPGEHTIWCISESRSYSISEGLEAWEPWDSYTWSLGEFTSEDQPSRSAICGVLVRSPRSLTKPSRPMLLPDSNPILIGAKPGEIEFCQTRPSLRSPFAIGFPPFCPVWALPADPLHSNKRDRRIVLLGGAGCGQHHVFQPDPTPRTTRRERREHAGNLDRWSSLILDAGRKGLQTDPNTADVIDLWKEYKRMAKHVRRHSL